MRALSSTSVPSCVGGQQIDRNAHLDQVALVLVDGHFHLGVPWHSHAPHKLPLLLTRVLLLDVHGVLRHTLGLQVVVRRGKLLPLRFGRWSIQTSAPLNRNLQRQVWSPDVATYVSECG